MAFIYWDVSPDLLHLGPLTIRWYGLFFAVLFWIGYLIGQWMFRIEHKDPNSLNSLLAYLIIATIIGARLGHCFFYEPGYYLSHPLEILKVWEGGLASHGGAIGILVAIYFYSRRHRDQPYLWVLDRVVVATALGGFFIWMGNMFNSELVGKPSDLPWAFVFARVDNVPRHPVTLYEAIAYLLIFFLLLGIYRRSRAQTPHGLLLGVFFVTIFAARFGLEFFKTRQATYEQNLPLSVGQLLSIPFVIAGALLIWYALKHRETPAAGTVRRNTPVPSQGRRPG